MGADAPTGYKLPWQLGFGASDNDEKLKEAQAPYRRSRKTKKQLLERYRTRLDVSKRWREDQEFDATWMRLLDLYRGKHFSGDSTEDRIAVNVSFATVNVLVPSVAVNHPQITINAQDEAESEQARTAEAMVNYWWRHYDFQREVKRSVKDSIVFGHGWVKVGWHHITKDRLLQPEERQAQYDQLLSQVQEYSSANPELVDQVPDDEEIDRMIPTIVPEIVKDCPFVERVDIRDIYIDPEATCVEDAKWIAQKIVVPLDVAQANDAYKEAVRKRLKADASTNPLWRAEDEGEKYSDEIKRVTIWEYYDLLNEFMCVFADQQHADTPDFLVDPVDFPYPYGCPFVMLSNYEVPGQFYPLGDLEMIEPLQKELNATRSAMMNHRKRYQRKYMALKDKLGSEAVASLQSERDGEIVWIDGDEDLSRLVMPLQQTPLDPQMYQYSDQMEADIDLISGVSEYQRGAAPEIRRTATEAAMIQDASNARAADKLASIELYIREIARRVVQLAQQYVEGEQVARIVDSSGNTQWVPYDIEAIQGEFDFTIEAGSTQPRNETFRRQQALQLANTLTPYITMGVVNPQALVSHILKEGFGIKNVQDFVLAPPPMIDPATGMPITDPAMQGQDPNAMPPQEGDVPPEMQGLTLPQDGMDAVPPNTQVSGY